MYQSLFMILLQLVKNKWQWNYWELQRCTHWSLGGYRGNPASVKPLKAQFNTWGSIPTGKKETDLFSATGLKRSTKSTLVTPREQTGHCKQVLAVKNTDVLCLSTALQSLHRTWGACCRQQSKLLEPWKMGKTGRMKWGNWSGLDKMISN